MFFQVAKKGRNEWYLYVITLILSGVGYMIGQIPFTFYLIGQGASLDEFQNLAKLTSNIEDKNFLLFLIALMFVVLALVFLFCLKVIHKKKVEWVATGAVKFRWNRFWFACIFWALLMLIFTVVGYYMEPEAYTVQFELKKFLGLVLVSVIFITIQSMTEELIFRGYLTQAFGLLFQSRLSALLIPALLFGAMHLANPEVVEHGVATMFPLYLLMGLVFGVMTLMDNGTELAMGYHVANNVMISLLLTTPESVLQTNSILKTSEIQNISQQYVSVIVSSVILIVFLAWKYKWNNWGQKLFGHIDSTSSVYE